MFVDDGLKEDDPNDSGVFEHGGHGGVNGFEADHFAAHAGEKKAAQNDGCTDRLTCQMTQTTVKEQAENEKCQCKTNAEQVPRCHTGESDFRK